ncbi:MAG: glycoside hydrolase family 95 protein [Williamsia sp.]|nr:glycoside hydrolase family 95 protein [Williamsia sp.]
MDVKAIVLSLATACLTFVLQAQQLTAGNVTGPLKLWYKNPAQKWTDALPLGNGRLGAMIFGGVEEDHIQFNEETLWTGGPRTYYRPGASNYLQPIRQLLFEGKQQEAETLAEQQFMGKRSHEEDYAVLKTAWFQKVRSDTSLATASQDVRWKRMDIPTPNGWEEAGWEGLDGAVWLRNSFQLPAAWSGKTLTLELGRIRDQDFTYINGQQVGTDEGISKKRVYTIPASVLRPGNNEIRIQVINYYDKGGLIGVKGTDKTFLLYPAGSSAQNALSLPAAWQYQVQDSMPPLFPQYEASYQPFGDLWFHVVHPSVPIRDYRRELDISQAVSRVTYACNGVAYTREYLSSAPDQTIAIRFTASKGAAISLQARLNTPHQSHAIRKVDDHTLGLSLKVRDGALKGNSLLRVQAQGGSVRIAGEQIVVERADTVTFYLVAATSFKNYKDVSANPEAICQERMQGLRTKNFETVKAAHTADYRRYFDLFSLYLGTSSHEELPTDERILQYTHIADPGLLALYVQYGRYLLISSSRPGTQPANLQGIWNNQLTPSWGSKYTTNINLEMNYWPAESLNLSALTEPLFHLISEAAEAGKLTAAAHYAAPGWVLHHNTDLWRGTAPINASNHGIWVTGAAWLCLHLWEHYLYTGDKTFLQQQGYPLMKQAADFFTAFLIRDPRTGWLISTPSNSPEHGGLVAGPTMDHQIIRELFKNCIAASQILQTDAGPRQVWEEKLKQLAPNQVGKLGELQEWLEQREDTTEKHRHVSHLWGIYPGTDITWDSTRLMQAARQSLLYRGDEGTGWSIAWKVNLWARFRDGDHALLMMDKLLSPAEGAAGGERGGVYHNMFDAHPPFQIDGNFGGAAGLAEMLLQSHQPWIELLPALPSGLPNGEVKGLCARGGFEFNLRWKEGKLTDIEMLSKVGGDCRLRYKDHAISLKTEKGQWYRFDGELKTK